MVSVWYRWNKRDGLGGAIEGTDAVELCACRPRPRRPACPLPITHPPSPSLVFLSLFSSLLPAMSFPQAVLQQLVQHVESHSSQDTYQVIFDWAASKLKDEVSPLSTPFSSAALVGWSSCGGMGR